MNLRRANSIIDIDGKCHMCSADILETMTIDFGTVGWPAKHGTSPLVSSISCMQNPGKRGLGNLLIGNMGFVLEREFSPHLAIIQLLHIGIKLWTIWVKTNDLMLNNNRWDANIMGSFLQLNFQFVPKRKGKDGMPRKHNKWHGKACLSMLELHGELLTKTWLGHLYMTMHLETMTKFGEGRNFSTTKLTLEPCVGTPQLLMWA